MEPGVFIGRAAPEGCAGGDGARFLPLTPDPMCPQVLGTVADPEETPLSEDAHVAL